MSRLKQLAIDWGLPVFFFFLPWQTRYIFETLTISGEPFQFGILSIYVTELFLLLVFLLSGKRSFSATVIWPARFVLLGVLAAAVSIGFALDTQLAIFTFMHLILAVTVFLALLDERVSLKRVGMGFVLGLIAPILLGIFQFCFNGSPASTLFGLASRDANALGESVFELADGTRRLRAYGSFPHPNIFGGFLVIGFLTAYWLRQSTKKNPGVWATLMVMCSLGLILTVSHSALMGLALAIAVILVARLYQLHKKKIRLPKRTQFLLLVIVFLSGAVLTQNFVQAFVSGGLERRSIDERIEQIEEFPSVIGSGWIFGHGIGNYTYAIEAAHPDRAWWEYQPIHNVPLLLIGEMGTLGFLCFLIWIISIDRMNISRFPHSDAMAAFMMGTALLIIALLDHYLWTSWAGLCLVAYVMALTARLGNDSV